MIRKHLISQTALLSLAFFATDASRAVPVSGPLQTIALTGDTAPGIAGRHFNSFEAPDINDFGQVAFAARLDCCSPMGTVYSTGRGQLELVAFQGSPVEPGSQLNFAGFGNVQIDNLGRTMIRGEMHDIPADFHAVWVGQENGMLTRVAVTGQAVDANEPNTTYRGIDFPSFGSGGVLAARGVSITGGHISPGSDVLFKSDGAGLAQPLLRADDPLDFLPAGVVIGTYYDPAFDNPVVNKHGQIAVRVSSVDTRGPQPEAYGSHMLLIEPDNSYASVGPPSRGSIPVLSDSGAIAYGALAGPQTINRKLPGQPAEVVARQGDQVPGMPGVRFDWLFVGLNSEMPIWINDRGDAAFWGSLVGEPIGNNFAESVWIGSPGNLRPVVIERTEAPGTGGKFASMTSTIGDMVRETAVNNKSQVAVLAYFEVIAGERRDGLFATDLGGSLRKIVAYGDLIEVAPGDFRVVDNVSFEGDAQGRNGTGLNDRGQIAFSVRFRDGTSGAFISLLVAVPEPTGLLLGATVVIAWTGFGRSACQTLSRVRC